MTYCYAAGATFTVAIPQSMTNLPLFLYPSKMNFSVASPPNVATAHELAANDIGWGTLNSS